MSRESKALVALLCGLIVLLGLGIGLQVSAETPGDLLRDNTAIALDSSVGRQF